MVRRGSQLTNESYFVIVDHPNEFDNAELVSGQEFARIPVNKTGRNPSVRSTGRIETAPAIDGVPVVDLLNAVAETIHCLVLQNVQPKPPPEVHELGADLQPAPV